MNCQECTLPGKFICNCKYLILCSIHQPLHMSETGHNSIECLNISSKLLESQTLKNEILKRIIDLNHSIENISTLSENIIRIVQICSRAAIINIENQVQLYLKLISLPKISESLKKELEKFTSSTLIIKSKDGITGKEFENVGKSIENFFKVEFFTMIKTETNKNELKQSDKKKTIEESKIKRRDEEIEDNIIRTKFLENKKIEEENKKVRETKDIEKRKDTEERLRKKQTESNNENLNDWTLDRKLQFLNTVLNRNLGNAQEIKFSRDRKYAFICKIYAGNFK